MKSLTLLVIGIFAIVLSSYLGLVIGPREQLKNVYPMTENWDAETRAAQPGMTRYPRREIGVASRGKEVYRAQGCALCHTQQPRRPGLGTDAERNWGDRQAVARDYIRQRRVLVGTSRIGPDLMNFGERADAMVSEGDATVREALYQFLYAPETIRPGVKHPSYPYLFEEINVEDEGPSEEALSLPAGIGPADPEIEVVPESEAEELVTYLLSLKLNYDLPEARRATE